MLRTVLIFLALFIFSINLNAGEAQVGKKAPEFQLEDFYGNVYKLTDYKGKWIVLEWVNYDCPYDANRYKSGYMHDLQKKYLSEGVVWFSIASADKGEKGYYDENTAYIKMREFNAMPTVYLMDRDKTAAKLYGVTKTPQIFIVNPKGVLVYAGAIDDSNSDDPAKFKESKNYISFVLDSMLTKSNKDTTNTFQPFTTKPFGCTLKVK